MTGPYANSSGARRPVVSVPRVACDAHMHVYDARFAFDGPMVDRGTAGDYLRIQYRLGTARTVVVTPRIYGTDNRVTLDAIERLGPDRTRGIAVLRPDVSDAQLQSMNDGGIRGIRFTLFTPERQVTDFTMVEPLAQRVHELGWHVQLHWTAAQIVDHAELLQRLPTTIVFDHLARLPVTDGIRHPVFDVVRRLLERDRAWIKLSGAYLDSQVGPEGGYRDLDDVARAWVRLAPERLVWGSDWPHSTEQTKPDDAELLDLLGRWADDEATRRRILVENPARLYDFPKTEGDIS
ncbi:amidohydrolase family protein [Bradyrhizobium sp. LHD-71]|uniref:amidohydrolase family protein n=1 Tax=Bradyrhizobium sp. LHD-71 TaxID=3072141 RepID=UPI00280EA2B7|nr:amidohydrolase family protein [Bradyrhizobium sp. LHD-71]MDQ8729255.1 amidohydrolase family protein [Bradyrhizobium sp. LHD-71]